jgi:hypothetical protein
MASPTSPTATTLATEGLILAGVASPSTPQIVQAKKSLEFIKGKLISASTKFGNARFKTLQTSEIIIGVIGQSEYSPASDYGETFSINRLSGTHTDTATAGGTNSVTLAGDEDVTVADARGRYILMTAGTSAGQYEQIQNYNATSKVVTTVNNWDSGSQPVNGDTYVIVDRSPNMNFQGELDFSELGETSVIAPPSLSSIYGGKIRFDKPFDATYGILHKYYADLNYINLTEGTGTLITKIYTKWQTVFRQAVAVDYLRSVGVNITEEKQELDSLITNLIQRELPGTNEFEGFEVL